MFARVRSFVDNHKILAALAVVMLGVLVGRSALSADADLQQYNGSAVWENDLTAASYLLPRDGKKITADSNAVGSAPVNRSLKQIKDYVIAMHRGIFGVGGTGRRTVYSLEADGVGGQTSSIDPAWIASTATNDRTLIKPTSVQVFDRGASGGETLLTKGALAFINTVDGGGNPARTSPINNKVMPINTAKAWVNIQTQTGVVTYADGYNITSCTVQSNTEVYCDLAITLDSTSYMPIANTALGDFVECFNTSTSRITCSFSGTQNCNGVAGCKLKLLVFGRQTT